MRFMPPEWCEQDAVIISWPHNRTDWQPVLLQAQDCFQRIAQAIASHETLIIVAPDIDEVKSQLDRKTLAGTVLAQAPTNDTWARDFGFISLYNNDEPLVLNFTFNAWGMKFAANLDNQVNMTLKRQGFLSCNLEDNQDMTLEGGSIECDGNGTIMTTSECLLESNRNPHLSREEIENQLKERLGAKQVLWLDFGYLAGDDTDSHIDTLARFAPGSTILYCATDDPSDEHFSELDAMRRQLETFRDIEGKPYTLLPLPLPSAILDDDGKRLPATYANFLVTNKQVLVPTYHQPKTDGIAIKTIAKAFPNHRVIGIDCRTLIEQHGSLHCVTMQVPKGVLKPEILKF